MSNLEWQKKILDSDKNPAQDSAEKIAIAFIQSQEKAGMPPDRLDKLTNAITQILKEKQHDEKIIQKECEEVLKELKGEMSFVDYIGSKAINITTDIISNVDILTSTNDKIQKFNKQSGNESILVKDFEKELSTKNITDINSVGFAHYLIYLQERNSLTSTKLGAILGGYPVGKKKLQNLAILWGLDSDKGTINTNVQKKLKNDNPMVLEKMRTLLSKELHEYLKGPKNEHIKTILKAKFPDTFNEKEFDKKAGKDVINIQELAKYLKQFNIKKIEDIETLLEAHKKDILEEKRKIEIEDKLNRGGKPWDMVNKGIELTNRQKSIEVIEQENIALEDPKVRSSMLDYLSGKITQKEFHDVVTKRIKQNQEELTKKKKKSEQKQHQKEEKKTFLKETSRHKYVPLSKIKEGESQHYPLDSKSPHTNVATIKKESGYYVIQLGTDPENITKLPTITKANAYMKNLRFLEQSGLGYFIRHISQSNLSTLLDTISNNTTHVNIQGGRFGNYEKRRILSFFGKVLGIKDANNIMNPQDGKEKFKSFSTHTSVESVLLSKNIIQNGVLNIRSLQIALESEKTT